MSYILTPAISFNLCPNILPLRIGVLAHISSLRGQRLARTVPVTKDLTCPSNLPYREAVLAQTALLKAKKI